MYRASVAITKVAHPVVSHRMEQHRYALVCTKCTRLTAHGNDFNAATGRARHSKRHYGVVRPPEGRPQGHVRFW